MQPQANAPANTPTPNPWPRSAKITAWIAFACCLAILLLLGWNEMQSRRHDPLNSPELAALKADLAQAPLDDALKQRVRAYDLDLRQKLARHQALADRGAWLLLAGLGIGVLAIKYGYYRKRLGRPEKKPITTPIQAAEIRQSLASVLGFTALAGGAALLVSSQSSTLLMASAEKKPAMAATAALEARPTDAPEPAPVLAKPVTPFPTAEEIAKNWPRFRGPGGAGVAAYTNYPMTWNVTNGENLVWTAKIASRGAGSPVVWDDRLFITGASAKKRDVFCYSAKTGALLWQKEVPTGAPAGTDAPNVMEETGGFAPSTAAVDGRRVYVIFATGDIAAFEMDGKPAWAYYLGLPDNSYGHAASLDLYQDRLIVQFDQGDGKDGKSKLLAINTVTGKLAWESAARPVPNTWSTPLVFKAGAKDLIATCGNPWVIAYDATNGAEVWRAKVLYGEVTPSPIFSAGLLFTVMEGEKLSAIKPDGVGDVTKTHVAWTAEEGLPDITSPVADGKYLYTVTSSGTVTAFEIASGKQAYSHELEVSFKASPSVVGDRLLLITDQGAGIWAQTGPEFKELGRAEFADEILASPAFLDGSIIVRGMTNLVCIGKK